jgi:hypothetical protein
VNTDRATSIAASPLQIEQGASDQEMVEWLNQSGGKNAGRNQTLG